VRDQDEFNELTMPVFVRETGLAVVHKGERITPAAGSEAILESTPSASAGIVNYYFPVEVVIVGGLPEEEQAAIVARVWESLGEALDRLA
jgi:hypothetical protein